MRKYILLLSTCLLVLHSAAQVGINTINPQNGGVVGVLHIDGSNNNNTTGVPTLAQTTDDVLINSLGRMSIGHITPISKLHILTAGTPLSPVPGLKIEDGSQGITKLLISDSIGNSRWGYAGEMKTVTGVLDPNGITDLLANYTTINYTPTGSYIDLPPGEWMVMASMVLTTRNGGTGATTRGWVRSTFASSAAQAATSECKPIFISGLAYATTPNTMYGFSKIYNQSGGIKRYYYCLCISSLNPTFPATVELVNFGSSVSPQNYIIALKMKD